MAGLLRFEPKGAGAISVKIGKLKKTTDFYGAFCSRGLFPRPQILRLLLQKQRKQSPLEKSLEW
jgi:hypothetical protein